MPQIIRSVIREGIWYGEIAGLEEGDEVSVEVHERTLSNVRVSVAGNNYRIVVPIPPQMIAAGVNTFVLSAAGESFGNFTVIAGELAADDLRAEVALLRSELDMLKRAFRRHLRETI